MTIPPVIKKIIGFALIFMSIAFVFRLILFFPILAGEFSEAIKGNSGAKWGSFTFYLLLNIIFWIVTYYMFRIGRRLFKSNQ